MKKFLKTGLPIIPLAIMLLSTSALANLAGDSKKGEMLYKNCVPCHGNNASKMSSGLSQDEFYDMKLMGIKSAFFENKKALTMQTKINTMSMQELHDLAAYITQIK